MYLRGGACGLAWGSSSQQPSHRRSNKRRSAGGRAAPHLKSLSREAICGWGGACRAGEQGGVAAGLGAGAGHSQRP